MLNDDFDPKLHHEEHNRRIREAETHRLLQQARPPRKPKLKLRDRFLIRFGDLFISFGTTLKCQVSPQYCA